MRKFAHVCFRHAQLSRMSVSDMHGIRAHVCTWGDLFVSGWQYRPAPILCLKMKCNPFPEFDYSESEVRDSYRVLNSEFFRVQKCIDKTQ